MTDAQPPTSAPGLGLTLPTSAPGLGLTPATSPPGLGLTPAHICAGTGVHPCPHLPRDWAMAQAVTTDDSDSSFGCAIAMSGTTRPLRLRHAPCRARTHNRLERGITSGTRPASMPRNKGPPLRARSMGCGARASPARSVAAGIPVPLPIRWISALPCPCLPTEQSTAWSAADRELARAVCSVHRTGCNAHHAPCTGITT